MDLGIVLALLASVVAGIATNIITDRWKVPGSGRVVASVVVALLIAAVGLTVAEKWVSGGTTPVTGPTTTPTATSTTPTKDPSTPPTTEKTTEPTTTPTTTPPPTSPPTEATEPGFTVAKNWSGDFLLHQVTGLELDTKPASSATGPAGNLAAGDLFYDNREALGNFLYAGDGPMALWERNSTPDAAACIETVRTVAVSRADPSVGQVLCVGTNGGRIARLKITQAAYEGVRFSVTVWNVKS